MAPALQAAHPEIRTYAGRGADGSSIRLDVTPMGFHAFVRRADGRAWYVDPAQDRVGEDRVLSYFGAAMPARPSAFVERDLKRHAPSAPRRLRAASRPPRRHRLHAHLPARLPDRPDATPTYFGGTANVLAAKTSLINRVNEVYNDDLAIKFMLVAGTDTQLNLDTEAEATGAGRAVRRQRLLHGLQLADCSGADARPQRVRARPDRRGGQLRHRPHRPGRQRWRHRRPRRGRRAVQGRRLHRAAQPRTVTSTPSTTSPTRSATRWVATTPSTAPRCNCSAGNRNIDPFTTQVEPGSGSSIMAYAGICAHRQPPAAQRPLLLLRQRRPDQRDDGGPPSNENEQQVVNFTGLDAGEQFTISCARAAPRTAVTFTGTPADIDTVDVAAVSVRDGDQPGRGHRLRRRLRHPSAAGLHCRLGCGTSDIPTLTIAPVAGATFTTFTGTIYNGGPATNQGAVTATANHSPVVTAPRGQDDPGPDAVHPDRVGAPTPTRRHADLHVGADRPGGLAGTGLVEQQQAGRAAVPAVRGRGQGQSPADTLLYHSPGREPGRHLAEPDLPRPGPDPGRQHQRRDRHVSGAGGARHRAGHRPGDLDCFSEFLPTGGLGRQPAARRGSCTSG